MARISLSINENKMHNTLLTIGMWAEISIVFYTDWNQAITTIIPRTVAVINKSQYINWKYYKVPWSHLLLKMLWRYREKSGSSLPFIFSSESPKQYKVNCKHLETHLRLVGNSNRGLPLYQPCAYSITLLWGSHFSTVIISNYWNFRIDSFIKLKLITLRIQ